MNSQRSIKERFLKKSYGQNSNTMENLTEPKTKKGTGFFYMYFIPESFRDAFCCLQQSELGLLFIWTHKSSKWFW